MAIQTSSPNHSRRHEASDFKNITIHKNIDPSCVRKTKREMILPFVGSQGEEVILHCPDNKKRKDAFTFCHGGARCI